MAITINTNISSLIVQSNLEKAANSLNRAIERLATGCEINDLFNKGYFIANNGEIRLDFLGVVVENAMKVVKMLTASEDVYALISSHLHNVRNLAEQAVNESCDSVSLKAIQSEIMAKLEEINHIAENFEFKGLKMMNDSMEGIVFQADSTPSGRIELDESLFKACDVVTLFTEYTTSGITSIEEAAKFCTGVDSYSGEVTGAHSAILNEIDKIISEISTRAITLDSVRRKIESNIELLKIQSENIASSLSTLWDADVAEESSNYTQTQILQQISAGSLITAS